MPNYLAQLYDPARQSPTLEQKQYYADWSKLNPQIGVQPSSASPERQAAYATWLKSPQQLDFEQWYARQGASEADQNYWNAGDAAWMAGRDAYYAENPTLAPKRPGVYTPATTQSVYPSTSPTNNTGRRTIDPIPGARPGTPPATTGGIRYGDPDYDAYREWFYQQNPGMNYAGGSAFFDESTGRYRDISPESAARFYASRGSQGTAGAGLPPGLPAGFDVRVGSTDPAVNQQVYGTNYFPGNLPGVTTKEQFFALSPEQQGDYRAALARKFQASQTGGRNARSGAYGGTPLRETTGGRPGTPTPSLPISSGNPDPRGSRAAAEATGTGVLPRQSPGSFGTLGPTPGGNPPPGGEDPRSLMNGSAYAGDGRPAPGQTMGGRNARVPEFWDFQDSPQYQFRQKQAERNLNRILLARGRADSTGGINALSRRADEIAADEIDKQSNRALAANMLNYGRDYGEDERDYGRFFSEDDRAFNRNALLTQLGQRAAELAAQQSVGYGRDSYGNIIDTNQRNNFANTAYTNALMNMLLGYGSDQSRNEWAALNPLIGLLMQGGQNNAALYEALGGLPTNILTLLEMLRGGRSSGTPEGT